MCKIIHFIIIFLWHKAKSFEQICCKCLFFLDFAHLYTHSHHIKWRKNNSKQTIRVSYLLFQLLRCLFQDHLLWVLHQTHSEILKSHYYPYNRDWKLVFRITHDNDWESQENHSDRESQGKLTWFTSVRWFVICSESVVPDPMILLQYWYINRYWIYLILRLAFFWRSNNPLQHISFATYRDGSLYNSLCLFLIISFKFNIAVFATTLIDMQNYRQKIISPNILILFKK